MKQRVGDLAGDHVGLVAVGNGENQVGVLGAGLLQHVGMRRMPEYGTDVQMILQSSELLGVAIDDGDVVRLAGQDLGDRYAHLART